MPALIGIDVLISPSSSSLSVGGCVVLDRGQRVGLPALIGINAVSFSSAISVGDRRRLFPLHLRRLFPAPSGKRGPP